MIITIFGATGMVGRHLVQQALLDGHTVRAFGRNVHTAGFPENENLHLLAGALFDGSQVKNAIKGSDAVLSALGGSTDGNDVTRSLGMKNIVEQMKKAGVKRIIAVGGKGILDGEEGIFLDDPAYPAAFIPVGKEHYKAWKHLESSDLEWTIIGSPDIIEHEATGVFRTSADTPPDPDNNYINAGDLALFMLNHINRNEYIRKRVGISN